MTDTIVNEFVDDPSTEEIENYRTDFLELFHKNKKLFLQLTPLDYNELKDEILMNYQVKNMIKICKFLDFILEKKFSTNGKPYFGADISNIEVRNHIIKDNNVFNYGYISRPQITLCLLNIGFVYKELSRTPTFNIDLKSFNKYYSINCEFRKNTTLKKLCKRDYNRLKYLPEHIQLKQFLVDTFNSI